MAKINNNGIGGKITISYKLIQQIGRMKINIDESVTYARRYTLVDKEA